MKIFYASDIHSEYMRYPEVPRFGHDADIIVLAGDIGVGVQANSYVSAVAADYPGAHIIWVAGNHEFYGGELDGRLEEFRRFAQSQPRIHFLENSKLEIDGVEFLGCTLWTDFSVMGEQSAQDCKLWGWRHLADGSNIRCGERPLRSDDLAARFRNSYGWLDRELHHCNPARTVVITHFPPCREARHGNIPEDYLSAYFQANAKTLVDRHQMSFWIYGHNHWSDQMQFGKTRVLSNQFGYPNERDALERFKDQAYFEL